MCLGFLFISWRPFGSFARHLKSLGERKPAARANSFGGLPGRERGEEGSKAGGQAGRQEESFPDLKLSVLSSTDRNAQISHKDSPAAQVPLKSKEPRTGMQDLF